MVVLGAALSGYLDAVESPTFDELWQKLCSADESVEIEAKRAEEVGKSVLATVSAFANEPDRGGGYLLLGVTRDEAALFPDYAIVGVPKPDKIQADLATQCRDTFNIPIRPEIRVEQHNKKNVVVVHIPEAADHDKPVYVKAKGLPKGAFRRVVRPTKYAPTTTSRCSFRPADSVRTMNRR